ncbi:transposase [Gluconobacter albidus]|uniref:transposase n=1 Tax=Gluconobacter albidus TaxID=318683 RepID=UPI0038D1B925
MTSHNLTGCPWRDMHDRSGKWNSVYVRFRRWAEQGGMLFDVLPGNVTILK